MLRMKRLIKDEAPASDIELLKRAQPFIEGNTPIYGSYWNKKSTNHWQRTLELMDAYIRKNASIQIIGDDDTGLYFLFKHVSDKMMVEFFQQLGWGPSFEYLPVQKEDTTVEIEHFLKVLKPRQDPPQPEPSTGPVKTPEQYLTMKKKLLVEIDAKCHVCGYKKHAAALDYHPHDPKSNVIHHLMNVHHAVEEDAYQKAKKELTENCKILCANCTREMHFPGFDIP